MLLSSEGSVTNNETLVLVLHLQIPQNKTLPSQAAVNQAQPNHYLKSMDYSLFYPEMV